MKKFIKIAGTFLKSVLLGSADIFPSIKENLNSSNPMPGQLDYIRIAAYIIQLCLILAFVFGKITIDDLKQLLKQF